MNERRTLIVCDFMCEEYCDANFEIFAKMVLLFYCVYFSVCTP